MEKLSSILPASPRVKSVDTSESAPARPGAPAIGRPAGRNTVKDRLSISADAKEMAYILNDAGVKGVIYSDPLGPVRTTNRLRGMTTSMFFRLCWRAPLTRMLAGSSEGMAGNRQE